MQLQLNFQTDDGRCMYDDNCQRAMIVYGLQCTICESTYCGKSQRYMKKWMQEHFTDVWKVIKHGRKNHGKNWFGSGGYSRADAFAKHFAEHCRVCRNSNEVKARLKQIVKPTILWQDKVFRCMKSAQTLNCKICMVERKEILKRLDENKSR